MKALIVGPGRIGCGMAGHALHRSGYELVFVGRNPDVVDHLSRVGRYRVRLVDGRRVEETVVDGVRAVSAYDPERLAEEVRTADLITTSVGCQSLLAAGALLADGLRRRPQPVNVLAFENMGNGGACLAHFIAACGRVDAAHGFSGALVSRVVAQRLGDPRGDEPLVFVGDPAAEFVVNARTLVAPVPAIEGMRVVEDWDAWVQRKLFTFSAGHATAAYLGFLKGYRYIHTAVRDPEIRDGVLDAMREGQKGLLARFGPEVAGTEEDLGAIVARFENAALNDSIDRVGRDPLRKLAPEDRIVGPARLAQAAGVRPGHLMLAAAAALLYCNPGDPSAVAMQRELQQAGPEALDRVSGFHADTTLGRSVVRAYCRLAENRPPDSKLLSLDRFFWA